MSHYVFFEPVFVKGQRRRFEADVDWTWESIGVRAEYTDVRDTRDGQGFLDNDLAGRACAVLVRLGRVRGHRRAQEPAREPPR